MPVLTAAVNLERKIKYGFFPAVFAAWNIKREDFMSGIASISGLKLRASIGKTGNQGATDPYQSLATVTAGNDYIFQQHNLQGRYYLTACPTPI